MSRNSFNRRSVESTYSNLPQENHPISITFMGDEYEAPALHSPPVTFGERRSDASC